MTNRKSVSEALNVFSTLASLFIDFGGDMPKFLNHRSVWLRSYVGAVPATCTGPGRDVIEPTKDYFLAMAALAREIEQLLIKHAETHGNSPGCAVAWRNLGDRCYESLEFKRCELPRPGILTGALVKSSLVN
jgi:hypothetical protein